AHAGLDPAVEEPLERVLVRRPDGIVPAELAAHEREVGVDLHLGLVPGFSLRLLHPTLDLAPLLRDAGKAVAEHERHPALDRVALAAGEAAERPLVHLLGELVRLDRAAADGAAEDRE